MTSGNGDGGAGTGVLERLDALVPHWRELLVAVVAGAVYLNAIPNGFTFDDYWAIEVNRRVHDWTDLGAIWLRPYWSNYGEMLGLYRPLTTFAFAIQWALGGGDPWLFNATSIVLHAGASLLVFVLLRRLLSAGPALVGGLIFAVHPVHTEAVANSVGQAELWVALAVLSAACIWTTRPEGPGVSRKRAAAVAVLYLLGFLAKENAVVLPGLLILLDVCQGRVRFRRTSVARYLRANAVPGLVAVAVVLAVLNVRLEVLGSVAGSDANPALSFLRGEHRLLSAFRAWPEYARLLFYPVDLAADYSPARILPVETPTPMSILGAAILVACIGLTAAAPARPVAGLAAGWFLVTILPVSNLLFPIGVLVAERTLYLPSFTAALVLAALWRAGVREAEGRAPRIAVTGIAALVLVLMGARTVERNPDWRTNDAILGALYRDHPESYRAQWRKATRAVKAGDTGEAARHWELGYRLWPHDPEYVAQYGTFEMTRGRVGRAAELLERAVALESVDSRYWRTLALAYHQAGREEDAIAATDTVLARVAGDPFSLRIRALSQMALGRHADAIATWRARQRFLDRIGRDEWDGWMFLADALAQTGRWDAAFAALDTARALPGLGPRARAALDTTRARIEAARDEETPPGGDSGGPPP